MMSWGEGWRRRGTFSVACQSEPVFCCHCGFSLDFLHEFLEFNNLEACRTVCQIPHCLTAAIKKFTGILKVDMGK